MKHSTAVAASPGAASGSVIGGNGGDAIAATYVIVDGTTVPQFNLSGWADDDGFTGEGDHATGNDPEEIIQVPGVGGSIGNGGNGGGNGGGAGNGSGGGSASANAKEIASVKALPATGSGMSQSDQSENLLMAGGLLALMGAAMSTLRRKL